jgi:hypothetical protein
MSRLFIPLSCSLFLVFIVERSKNRSLFVLLKGHAGNTCKKNATSVRMLISVKKTCFRKIPPEAEKILRGEAKEIKGHLWPV